VHWHSTLIKKTQQCQAAAVNFLVNHSKAMDINRNMSMNYDDDNQLDDEDMGQRLPYYFRALQ
jgi:hypothetical protein